MLFSQLRPGRFIGEQKPWTPSFNLGRKPFSFAAVKSHFSLSGVFRDLVTELEEGPQQILPFISSNSGSSNRVI